MDFEVLRCKNRFECAEEEEEEEGGGVVVGKSTHQW